MDRDYSQIRRARRIGRGKSESLNKGKEDIIEIRSGKMKRKNGQFGEKLSPGQPFRVSIILRQEARVAKSERTKRKGRTYTQANRRKQKKKSGQDYRGRRLTTRKKTKKKDGRKSKRRKLQRKSDHGRGVKRKKMKNRNDKKVKVRRKKDQEKSKGNSDQDINRRRRRKRRTKTRSNKRKGRSSSTRWKRKGRQRLRSKRKQQSRVRQSRRMKEEDGSEDIQHCKGALIKEKWIITAANCFDVSQI